MSRGIFPRYSKSAVNRAGENVRNNNHNTHDIGVIENWRASHNYVLNTFQANLRNRCRDKDITFAQRLKRRNTIFDKLSRLDGMKLARMHDIAGCRLIFPDENALREFRKSFHKCRFKHKRRLKISEDGTEEEYYDYISNPRDTGYRGIHDVYEYRAKQHGGEKWNGLLVEIQYRTKFQHAWATAVEICDSITANRGKFDQADVDYLGFFRVTSEIIARCYEGSTSCIPDITNEELYASFIDLEGRLHLLRTLEGINITGDQFRFRPNMILIFDEREGTLETKSFRNAIDAIGEYFKIESESDPEVDVVLVRADSTESVQYAFKNYFSDTTDFVALVKDGVDSLAGK